MTNFPRLGEGKMSTHGRTVKIAIIQTHPGLRLWKQRVDFEGPGHRLRQFRTPIPIYAEPPAKAPTLATIDYCRIVVEIDEG